MNDSPARSLSVVVPVYQEAPNIAIFCDRLWDVLEATPRQRARV